MFFDDPITENETDLSEWKKILIGIAAEQHKLLRCRCDAIPYPYNGTDTGAGRRSAEYKEAAERLKKRKAEAADYAKRQGFPLGMHWWGVEWDMVEEYLVRDLLLQPETSNYRFRREWRTETDSGWKVVYLKEHVHFQSFSASKSVSYGIASQYSAEEIEGRMSTYNRDITALDYMLTRGSDIRYSRMDDKYYEGAAWMGSSDYIYRRMALDKMKRDSLYSEKETSHLRVSGIRGNRDSLYLGAAYRTYGGTVTDIQLFPYCVESRTGEEIPGLPEMGTVYAPCRAALEIAAREDVKSIPLETIKEDLTSPSDSFDNAVFQSELFTCLAAKLTE